MVNKPLFNGGHVVDSTRSHHKFTVMQLIAYCCVIDKQLTVGLPANGHYTAINGALNDQQTIIKQQKNACLMADSQSTGLRGCSCLLTGTIDMIANIM